MVRGIMSLMIALASILCDPSLSEATQTGQDPPRVSGYRIVRTYYHDPTAFTQGLLWANGSLFESTGLYGRSQVRELKLGGSEAVRYVDLNPSLFGEGLALVGQHLVQLLWKRPEVRWYSVQAGDGGHLERASDQASLGNATPLQDGWGLAYDGERLLATDSGSRVYHLEPWTFRLLKTVQVVDHGRGVEMLNELEIVDGELWANVFGTECIVRIDVDSGQVLGYVVFKDLLNWRAATWQAKAGGRAPPDVFNGIAWDPDRRRLFVTGKRWPVLFEVELAAPPLGLTLQRARFLCMPQRNLFV